MLLSNKSRLISVAGFAFALSQHPVLPYFTIHHVLIFRTLLCSPPKRSKNTKLFKLSPILSKAGYKYESAKRRGNRTHTHARAWTQTKHSHARIYMQHTWISMNWTRIKWTLSNFRIYIIFLLVFYTMALSSIYIIVNIYFSSKIHCVNFKLLWLINGRSILIRVPCVLLLFH